MYQHLQHPHTQFLDHCTAFNPVCISTPSPASCQNQSQSLLRTARARALKVLPCLPWLPCGMVPAPSPAVQLLSQKGSRGNELKSMTILETFFCQQGAHSWHGSHCSLQMLTLAMTEHALSMAGKDSCYDRPLTTESKASKRPGHWTQESRSIISSPLSFLN